MSPICTNEERADAKIAELDATMRNIERLLADDADETSIAKCRRQVQEQIRNIWWALGAVVAGGAFAFSIIMYHVVGDIVRYESHDTRISAVEREMVRLHPSQYGHEPTQPR